MPRPSCPNPVGNRPTATFIGDSRPALGSRGAGLGGAGFEVAREEGPGARAMEEGFRGNREPGRRGSMNGRSKQRGFTLVEVIVVVAVIAILAAVLTPYITKYIDDSRVAKAKNETQVIAAALTNAYKHLGGWPNRNTATTDYNGLYTSTTPTTAFFGTATGWAAPGAAWNLLDTHLVTNGHTYPATGETRGNGPERR